MCFQPRLVPLHGFLNRCDALRCFLGPILEPKIKGYGLYSSDHETGSERDDHSRVAGQLSIGHLNVEASQTLVPQ
jgi:hypothetical protein